ncbi:circularly permuted type 2 ATP-grasp protein [Marinobacterium sp. YM272]|uniref:circularly permuted type 2 ATP-grasp protein n=1 Tax=Marinobacterium sp. YM272 TaxID=3421654 RepID=UPI003D7F5D6A
MSQASSALNYDRPNTFYDEVFGPDGQPQEHWRYLLEGLGSIGEAGLQERQRKAERILRDDGATYNISSDTESDRSWGLDPVPLLIGSEEWSRIEMGLIERAELLDLVLKDLYGPRDLIRHRVIPPELIYSHHGFLRACQGIKQPGDKQLIYHAVDMVRGEDGNMVVIGDRTQAPSGVGYALENRTVMSRVLPSLFRDSQVHRLSLYFQALRRKMASLSPNGDSPRVVILTPGAYSETYFEHTYLANYLGYALVQGGDLTVRNGYVWMKSLDGLHRVDIIMRRVDDTWCDPVELRADSHLGVPGLLEVARAGNVVITNPLGSGVLENPALHKFMPKIAEFFLGHELQLPSTRTWWMGDQEDRDYILANLRQLIIKPTARRSGEHSIYCANLSEEDFNQLKRRISDDPLNYIAQQANLPGSSPSWQRGELKPRATVLRSFAVADQSAYCVMPGGLTRVASSDEQWIVSNQLGATSKDTWVLASEPQRQVSYIEERAAGYTEDQTSDLPSRVVENLFWLGRYSERAEAGMRLLRTVLIQLNSLSHLPLSVHDLMLKAITQVTTTYPGFTQNLPEMLAQPEKELMSVILDRRRPGSITANLHAMLNCSEETKEMLSADTHRVINDLRDELAQLPQLLGNGLSVAPEEALDPLVTSLLALSGLTQESMIRGFGWRFLELGRRLERTLQSTALLRAMLVPVLEDSEQEQVIETVLLTTEVLITYRRRYRTRPQLDHGLTLIMLDKTNPRSLHYQVDLLRQHIEQLQSRESSPVLTEEHRCILEALTLVQLSRPAELAVDSEDSGVRDALNKRLARVQTLLSSVATAISDRYFDHRSGPQQLVQTGWSEEP